MKPLFDDTGKAVVDLTGLTIPMGGEHAAKVSPVGGKPPGVRVSEVRTPTHHVPSQRPQEKPLGSSYGRVPGLRHKDVEKVLKWRRDRR